jgi:hypothetical protein
MSLHWPSCVPYSSSREVSQPRPYSHNLVSRGPRHRDSDAVAVHPIYGATLKPSEFRLACLAPPESQDDPIHVHLEAFADDSHPEYETVSYVWGGENGDSTLSQPIFVGHHWDILFQTENCQNMLRSIRPARGIRLVWVDALCINQQNLQERASQVAKMRRIYEQCTRVIAYLGHDIVTTAKPYPTYRPLYELHKANTNGGLFPRKHKYQNVFFGLKEMLSRRYFTRVWIIQELLLPERVVFRIGDTEFRADASIMSRITNHHLKSPTWWSETAAPWVQQLGQKRLLDQKIFCDTFAVLRFARRSHASDPRDRFFGIVALMHDEQLKVQFAPDYSISYRHLCIGLFAHWILNRGAYSLFYKARTLHKAVDNAPTWLPECDASGAWNTILDPNLDDWPYHCAHQFERLVDNGKFSADRYLLGPRRILEHEPDASRVCTLAAIPFEDGVCSWNQDSFVNTSTGALALNLIHLFEFDVKPELVQLGRQNDHIFKVGESESGRLYMTSRYRLDQNVVPGCDHLFLIAGTTSPSTGEDYT